MTFLRQFRAHWPQAGCLLAGVYVAMQVVVAQGQSQTPEPGGLRADVGPTAERKWVDAWAVSFLPTTVNGEPQAVPTFNNQTLRLNMFTQAGRHGGAGEVDQSLLRRSRW